MVVPAQGKYRVLIISRHTTNTVVDEADLKSIGKYFLRPTASFIASSTFGNRSTSRRATSDSTDDFGKTDRVRARVLWCRRLACIQTCRRDACIPTCSFLSLKSGRPQAGRLHHNTGARA